MLLAFCPLFAALYPLTQLYQLEEDTRRGDRTLACVLGVRRSLTAAVLAVISIGLQQSFLPELPLASLLGLSASSGSARSWGSVDRSANQRVIFATSSGTAARSSAGSSYVDTPMPITYRRAA